MPVKVNGEQWSRAYLTLVVMWPVATFLAWAWSRS